jgi:glycosyltransferase involved in cell wall biosynthesis
MGTNIPPFVEILPWSEDTELELLASSRVGIMPLPDEKFERGKCGFKLIQYMGIGLPTIASPIGENNYIIENGVTGFFAASNDQWYSKIKKILDLGLESKMGLAGYERYKSYYSTSSAEKKLDQLITSITK